MFISMKYVTAVVKEMDRDKLRIRRTKVVKCGLELRKALEDANYS